MSVPKIRLPAGAWWFLVLCVSVALLNVPVWIDASFSGLVPIVQALWPFTLVLVVGLAVIGVVCFWRSRTRVYLLSAGLVVVLWSGTFVGITRTASPGCPPSPSRSVTVLAANTEFGQATNVADLVRRTGADVVVMPESDSRFVAAVQKQLGDKRFAHSVVSQFGPPTATSVLSRYRISDVALVDGSRLESVAMTLDVDGGPLRLLAAHPYPPLPHDAQSWRTAQRAVEVWAKQQPRTAPVVMAGDFNASFAHPAFRSLRSGFFEAADLWHGVRPTWPQWPGGTGVSSIDHVLARDACSTGSGVLDLVGSDHRAVWATVVW